MHLAPQLPLDLPLFSKSALAKLIFNLPVAVLGSLLSTAGILCCPAPALSQSATSDPEFLLQVEGTLQAGDSVLSGDDSLFDIHSFAAEAGETIVITLESTQFDTYLLLVDEQGQKIAENDDVSESNRNSLIEITLPESGTYQVVANAYDDTGRGEYRLTVGLSQPDRQLAEEFAARPSQTQLEGVINGDQLVTINGIPWAATGWLFSKTLGIQRDSIDPTLTGRVVLDRHGEDTQPIFGIRSPFEGPRPGRAVLVSTWGSNNNGCFAELIFQIATTPDQAVDANLIVPTQLEMVINGQRLTLDAAENFPGAGRSFNSSYTYSLLVERNNELVSVDRRGVWLTARHIFPINAEQADILRSASAQEMPIRVTLTNRSPITIPIGDGTVERWSSVYGYNPSCAPNSSQ